MENERAAVNSTLKPVSGLDAVLVGRLEADPVAGVKVVGHDAVLDLEVFSGTSRVGADRAGLHALDADDVVGRRFRLSHHTHLFVVGARPRR